MLYRYVTPLDFEDGDMDTGLEELPWVMHAGKMSEISTLIINCLSLLGELLPLCL